MMILPPKIFRGDKRKNITMPELYRSEGLMSKGINGGSPAYIKENGLLASIRAHIKPLNENELAFLNKSEFISFTSDYSRAKYYASEGHPEKLVKCDDYYERRYIFTMDITSAIKLDDVSGIYRLKFRCNRNLIKPNSPLDVGLLILKNYPCKMCGVSNTLHSVLLINVVTYLKSHVNDELYSGAIKNASIDSEWLVLPSDYPNEMNGLSSARIPLANFWYAEHFVLNDEALKNPLEDGIKGQIFDDYDT